MLLGIEKQNKRLDTICQDITDLRNRMILSSQQIFYNAGVDFPHKQPQAEERKNLYNSQESGTRQYTVEQHPN